MLTGRGIVEFLDTPTTAGWSLTPDDAVEFLKAKGLKPSFNYQEVLGAEHARAFTVAKMMDTDMLADVKASLDDALANGTPFDEWAKTITPMLQQKGWWGMKQVVAPGGGLVNAQLGSPSRLQTIYRTNMQSAYAAGQWDGIVQQMDEAPFLMYDAVDDFRTRPEHHAWDNTVLPVTDAWWHTHYPPNGWNCRCNVIQLSQDDLDSLGIKLTAKAPDDGTYTWTNPVTGAKSKIPNGLDPGWNTNVGEARNQALAKAMANKVAGYPEAIRAAASKGFDLAREAGAEAAAMDQAAAIALQAELDTANLARKAMKASERAAAAKIDQHLADNTPYLAKSIKAVQSTKAGAAMSNQELLEAAQAHASKTEAQAALANYKQSVLAGKKPSAKGQAAFDALPAEASEAITEQLQAQLAKKAAEKAADAELSAIITGDGKTLQAKLLDKIMGAPGNADLSNVELLAKLQTEVAAAKAKQVQGQLLAGAKKAIINGKAPTPAQTAAMKQLKGDDLQAWLASIEKAKAEALPPPALAAPQSATTVTAPTTLDSDNLVQIGPQTGSNPGGLYRDTTTGETWYIKTPPDLAHAQNEVLAAKLYQAAGVEVPELRLTTLGGKPAVASRIVDDLAKASAADLAKTAGVREGFVVDAWLSNWDVVGAGFDNLLVRNGAAVRVDTGGALLFRAQGSAKGAMFGDTVTELQSLLDKAINPNTAKVFAGMTQDQLAASAARVLALSDDTIRGMVAKYGPDGELGAALAKRLITRKADLAKRFGNATEAALKAKQMAIAEAEFAAREGLKAIDDAMVAAIKGIASRTAKGLPLEAKDFERAQAVRSAFFAWNDAHADLLTDKALAQVRTYYDAWSQTVLDALSPGLGKVGAWKGEQFKGYAGALEVNPAAVKVVLPPEGISFTPMAAKQVMTKALGSSAANLDVPSNGSVADFKAVPLEHQRAITAYTGAFYRDVNIALREGRASPAVNAYADLLNEALAIAPKYVGEVTRGIKLDGSKLERFLADHRNAMATGQGVVHRGFISTSKGGKAAFTGNVVLHIDTRSGVWVKPISMHPNENEVLLPHGTRFAVKDVTERHGVHHIYLEEVGP